jgi:hypothetical protein
LEVDSRTVSRQWVTVDTVLCEKECELLFAYLVPSAAGADATLYNGDNATGELIATLESAAKTGHKFRPPVPVYCARGLFIDIGSNVTGVFVMWRGL